MARGRARRVSPAVLCCWDRFPEFLAPTLFTASVPRGVPWAPPLLHGITLACCLAPARARWCVWRALPCKSSSALFAVHLANLRLAECIFIAGLEDCGLRAPANHQAEPKQKRPRFLGAVQFQSHSASCGPGCNFYLRASAAALYFSSICSLRYTSELMS